MLDLPDTRQADGFSCGDTAQDCVFRFFGVRAGITPLATDADGLHPATVESVFRRAGMRVQSGTMTVADLAHHTRLGRAVLCPIDLFGGHWVVVRGVTRLYVHYQCPTEGKQRKTHVSWTGLWRDSTRAGHAFDSWGIAVWK